MRLPRPIQNSLLPLLLVLAAQKVCAQLAPADVFFNGGAQAYISNNIPAALERTESGLKFYPDDVKLKKLEQLLKQKQQQQQQQKDQSQQQKSDSQKNQQQQNQQSQKNSSQDRQKSDEQKQNQSDQKKDGPQNQPEPQKSADEKKDGDKQDKQDAEGQPVKPGQMTPEEAKRLLDAQKDTEQILQQKPKDKPEQIQKPVKDW
jgi:Ca-activated chloride channel family protein